MGTHDSAKPILRGTSRISLREGALVAPKAPRTPFRTVGIRLARERWPTGHGAHLTFTLGRGYAPGGLLVPAAVDSVSGYRCYRPVRSRWSHPGQQHGRRWPSSSSSCVRRMRRSRVMSCLASSTQQMNSLRARGVMSFQATSAVGLAINASPRSRGRSCTFPPGTCGRLTAPTVAGQGYPSPSRRPRSFARADRQAVRIQRHA